MDSGTQLRADVFGCKRCTSFQGFQIPSEGAPFSKFPPIIGAQRNAPLLFIGINPRRSTTNFDLHKWLMASMDNFNQLAENKFIDGSPYIAPNGPEPHYHCHMIIVEEVFEKGRVFESVAAVTELFLCASKSAPPCFDKSPCADRYLAKTIELVQPKIVIAVGSTVKKHLSRYFGGADYLPVIEMIHPSFLFNSNRSEKVSKLQPAILEIRKCLNT